MADYDILIPGNYFCDVVFSGFPHFPALGTEVYTDALDVILGGALNTVIALHRLGVKVGWRGQVGTDFFSRFAVAEAEKEGLDTSLLQHLDTSLQQVTVALSYPQDRAFISYRDRDELPVQMILDMPETVTFRHVHFTGLQIDSRAPALFDALHTRGVTISMDCQDNPMTLESPIVKDVLKRVDIFMPNASEAVHLTGLPDVQAAADALRRLMPMLVIKDGAKGAYLWHGETMLHQPALENIAPLDTTGAGDVFNAGFLAAYLENKPHVECLCWGSICGGLSTLGYGGTATAPHRVRLNELLK